MTHAIALFGVQYAHIYQQRQLLCPPNDARNHVQVHLTGILGLLRVSSEWWYSTTARIFVIVLFYGYSNHLRFQRDIGYSKGATSFALRNGIEAEDNLTDNARQQFEEWRIQHREEAEMAGANADRDESHDTVGVICLDDKGNLCAGT